MVPKFHRVMAVTDFSETGDAALPFAYSVADPGGEVHLVHVFEHTEVPNPLYAHYGSDDLNLPEKRREAEAKVRAKLQSLVPGTAGEKKVSTHAHVVVHENVPGGIIDQASALKADVIVIGSHGRTGLAHLLVGSVTEEILRLAEVPVLVVRQKARR